MIEPQVGTSKYKIGDHFDVNAVGFSEVEDRHEFVVYKSDSIWIFISKKSNTIDQVSVFSGCQEKTINGICVGSSLSDIKSNYGKLTKNDGVYEPDDTPGIAFELDRSKKVECISVSIPYQFSGSLPDHIKNQGKRILP